jgi:hypothetical protein
MPALLFDLSRHGADGSAADRRTIKSPTRYKNVAPEFVKK